MTGAPVSACELCAHQATPAWSLVFHGPLLRVVRVLDAPEFPAFYRVIWQAHVAEMSDLTAADRQHLMDTVNTVEGVLRTSLQPTKINLAAFGNMVPHLHWHVIARFDWDSHFPQPVWGTAQRTPVPAAVDRLIAPLVEVDARIVAALTA